MVYRIGFIVEQALGHKTYGINLQHFVSRDPSIEACWGLPVWEIHGLANKIPIYRSNWTIRAGLRTRAILSKMARPQSPHALFFHTQVTAVLAPDWLRRTPSVVSLDATPRQYDRLGAYYGHKSGPAWLENWKWRLNRDCFSLARHIVTWSEWTKQGLVTEYEVPADKISVIPPGVDTLTWAHPELRMQGRGPVRVLFVGGDLDRKGGRLLLKAFRRLRVQVSDYPNFNDGPRVELHLVTRTPVNPEPGVFVYSDMKPNSSRLKSLFFKSDIFCLPTLGDCLAMVLSEAGAAGLPTISTRIAAIPEIIEDGVTGFLVPPGDVEALTAALQHLIRDPELRKRQGQAAEQAVRQRYDARRNANRLIDLMKQISA